MDHLKITPPQKASREIALPGRRRGEWRPDPNGGKPRESRASKFLFRRLVCEEAIFLARGG